MSRDDAPIALARTQTCERPVVRTRLDTARGPNTRNDGKGVPAETVLRMLRSSVVPPARDCFRRDRAGRADYEVRAELSFVLRDREVMQTRVGGEVPPRLAACLEDALEALSVPYFTGTVVVTYPLVTEREPPPPRIELRDEVADGVDQLFGREPTIPDLRALSR